MSRVYVIVVNWNGWQDTIECLESLLKLQYPDFRIVVCDNGSDNESVVKLCAWCEQVFDPAANAWQILKQADAEQGKGLPGARVTIVTNATNHGFAGGTNVGLRYAQARADADLYWLLNNDTVVDSHALTAMVQRLGEKTDACMCGSTVREYSDRSRVQALGGARYFKWLGIAWHIGRTVRGDRLLKPLSVENRMDYVLGASLLVRSSYVAEVGLMAEEYFLYFEELDWFYRGQDRYSLAYAPESLVYHKVGASIGTATNPLRKSYLCDYYSLRNRIVFSRRHCPSTLPTVYLGLFGELLVRLLVGRWDRASMIGRLLWQAGREKN